MVSRQRGNHLTYWHAFSAFFFILDGGTQILGDQADGFQMEHIRHLPGGSGGVAFYGVRQSIHAGKRRGSFC